MNVDGLIDQGVAAGKAGRLAQAETLFRSALDADATHPRAWLNLAVAQQLQLKLEPALLSIRRSLELRPNDAGAVQGLGKILMSLNRVGEAIESFRRALQIAPDDAEAHGLLARALLITGDFKRGWAEYEWRWKCPSFHEPAKPFTQPRWNGARALDKTILLHHEQGFGDTIQFARYVPQVAERCGAVIVECPAELIGLIRRLPGVADIVALSRPLPTFDLHAAMMSLPLLFNTTLKTIPATVPYLAASKAMVESWQTKLRDDGAKFRVGLAWAGRATHPNDRNRSIALHELAPLADVEGVVFYSLQKEDPRREVANPPAGMRLVDSGTRLVDFSDAAGLIANLDLVISVDTAVVHLAGALGKPVWTLLPFAPDFRWLLDRADSPWYPSMTLVRQREPGKWSGVVREAAERLGEMVASVR